MLTEISRGTWFWCGEQGRTREHTQEWLNGVETGEKQCGHAGGPQWQNGLLLQSGCYLNIISTFSFFIKENEPSRAITTSSTRTIRSWFLKRLEQRMGMELADLGTQVTKRMGFSNCLDSKRS